MRAITAFVLAAALAAPTGCSSEVKMTLGNPGGKGTSMKPTIQCGRQRAEHANIAKSEFEDVNLSGSTFDNVSLAGAKFQNVNLSGTRFDDVNMSGVTLHDINLSDITVSAVQIGGAKFKHVGPPPDKDGRAARQRPVTFEEATLADSTFRKVDLSGVKIIDCNLDGMTIDGVPVTELVAAYKRQKK